MIVWDFVPLHTIQDELKQVFPRHHSEIADDDEPFNFDWGLMEAASKAGQAVVVTARDNQRLAGYIFFTVSRNIRHMHLIEAMNGGWYIEPEYRGRLGPQILKKSDEYLKAAGVHKTCFILNGRESLLLQRRGYKTKLHQVWEIKYE